MSGSDKRISVNCRIIYAGICHVSLSEGRETKRGMLVWTVSVPVVLAIVAPVS